MNVPAEEFISRGLLWIYERAGEYIRNTRLACGTNDIVIFARTKSDDPKEAHIYGRRRDDVVEAFKEVTPEAVRTIARLSQQLPPDRVHLVVVHDRKTWVLDVYVPKGAEAAGVLN